MKVLPAARLRLLSVHACFIAKRGPPQVQRTAVGKLLGYSQLSRSGSFSAL
jgi:hypothetical protein